MGPRKRLTSTRIAALRGAGDYTDPECPGLLVHVAETGTRSWQFRFYDAHGKRGKLTLGRWPTVNLVTAHDLARRAREALAKGIDPRRAGIVTNRLAGRAAPGAAIGEDAADAAHTIAHLAAEFVERYAKRHRRRPEQVEWLLSRDVLPAWRDRDARSITPRDVIELLDGIVERGAPVLANRTATLLSQLFRFGIQRRIVEANPVQLLFRPGGRERPRERVLSDEELKAFLADPKGCTRFERLAHVVTILLLTGQRRGELARARWAEIDLDAHLWTVPNENSKTGRGHAVPLSDWAAKEFEALKALSAGSRFVLPTDDGKAAAESAILTRGLARCRERFKERGIQPFNLHDLRRTCRTGLARLKVEPHVAERVLNHVQPGVAGVYDRFAYIEEKREALERWAAHLVGLASVEDAS